MRVFISLVFGFVCLLVAGCKSGGGVMGSGNDAEVKVTHGDYFRISIVDQAGAERCLTWNHTDRFNPLKFYWAKCLGSNYLTEIEYPQTEKQMWYNEEFGYTPASLSATVTGCNVKYRPQLENGILVLRCKDYNANNMYPVWDGPYLFADDSSKISYCAKGYDNANMDKVVFVRADQVESCAKVKFTRLGNASSMAADRTKLEMIKKNEK